MPQFDRGDCSIYYEEHGSGHPLVLIAPGGTSSEVNRWAPAALNRGLAG